MRRIILLIIFLGVTSLYAQDTIRVMHYNLLYYGESTGFCNFNNNNPDQKDAWLRTILTYARPDIITVNEMSENTTYHYRLLTQVMNQAGYALFDMSHSPNLAGSGIVNLLYYNTEKLAFQTQEVAQSELRDIDVYRLYHKEEGMAGGDTIFLHCIVAHLKAGSSGSDEDLRELMTENTLNYLEANGKAGNYLFMGDFNVYSDEEEAFQLMINNNDDVFRFYDPADRIGEWHNDAEYRDVHTQSTHTDAGGCHSSGGMDDRFDFILMNRSIYEQADNIYYLEGSYHALGQDGQRLNGSLLDPPNSSLPAYVLDALYGMSDHLPVIMDLVFDETLAVYEPQQPNPLQVSYTNPVSNVLELRISSPEPGPVNLILLSVSGREVYREEIMLQSRRSHSIPCDTLTAGMYILKVEQNGWVYSGKVVVVH